MLMDLVRVFDGLVVIFVGSFACTMHKDDIIRLVSDYFELSEDIGVSIHELFFDKFGIVYLL